jgi:hypothetical protein
VDDEAKLRGLILKHLQSAREQFKSTGKGLPTSQFKRLQELANTLLWTYKKDGPVLEWWIERIPNSHIEHIYLLQEALELHSLTKECEVSP